jgi:hypothetical protein
MAFLGQKGNLVGKPKEIPLGRCRQIWEDVKMNRRSRRAGHEMD